MTGDKIRFSSDKKEDKKEVMMGYKKQAFCPGPWRLPRTPAVPKPQERKQQQTMMGDKDLPFPADPRQHHPLRKPQERRQEEAMMGDKNRNFPVFLRQRHAVRKLQERRQEDIGMGNSD